MKKILIYSFSLLLIVFLAYKSIFYTGEAVWGDAPFFYKESLNELVSEPLTWVNRGTTLGGVNNLLWISPIMIVYGLLHKLLSLENMTIIKLLFYFPAIISSLIGAWLFARRLGISIEGRFITSLIYGINTYFLLLIDGGQVGVTLAYGIFPFALLALRQFIEKQNINNFYLSLILLTILGIADPRFSIIAFLVALFWLGLEILFRLRKVGQSFAWRFLLLSLSYILVNFWWLFPIVKLGVSPNETLQGLNLTSVLNGFLLYQPHWPNNEFGRILSPSFYFIGIPLLIFSNLALEKKKEKLLLLLLLLICIFFLKGSTPPLGNIYDWILENIPLSQSLRDSTKFFTPVILISAVLIGNSLDLISKIKVRKIWVYSAFILTPLYFILIIHPAILGNLNGVFAQRSISNELLQVKKIIQNDSSFSSSVWFPERHPFSFHSNNHPAFDAKELASIRPITSLNVGTYDRFNFLHNNQFLDWFRIFGIKHLVFSGEFRKELKTEEKDEWQKLLALVDSNNNLKKVDGYPVYEVDNTLPQFYTVDKVVAVVGGDDIYQKIGDKQKNFSISNQGFIFVEDGKVNPKEFQEIASGSAVILFNDKSETDLTLSHLQEYFLGSSKAQGNWALRNSGDYLKWKYELLNQGVETREFDYNLGIAFSSQPGEEITYEINTPANGKFVLALRGLSKNDGELLQVTLNNEKYEIPLNSKGFSWGIKEGIQLEKGKHVITIQNTQGFKVINTVSLIPEQKWIEAKDLTKKLTQKFKSIYTSNNNWHRELENNLNSNLNNIETENVGTLRVKANLPKEKWLVFTDSYHKDWYVTIGPDKFSSMPIYSAINGFYTERGGVSVLTFKGQEYFRWGLWVSIISLLVLSSIFSWNKSNEKSH